MGALLHRSVTSNRIDNMQMLNSGTQHQKAQYSPKQNRPMQRLARIFMSHMHCTSGKKKVVPTIQRTGFRFLVMFHTSFIHTTNSQLGSARFITVKLNRTYFKFCWYYAQYFVEYRICPRFKVTPDIFTFHIVSYTTQREHFRNALNIKADHRIIYVPFQAQLIFQEEDRCGLWTCREKQYAFLTFSIFTWLASRNVLFLVKMVGRTSNVNLKGAICGTLCVETICREQIQSLR